MSRPLTKMGRKELFLPTSVIMEILSRLPTMSVLRFHCISKEWFNILRDEYFRDLHSDVLLHSRSPSLSYPKILLSTTQVKAIEDPEHPTAPKQQLTIIISSPGSTSHHVINPFSGRRPDDGMLNTHLYLRKPRMHCNGLLCFTPSYELLGRPIIVCNPLTLEYLALPPCITMNDDFSCVGFGFAPLSKRYKVVCIHPRNTPNSSCVVEVYTLGDTTWRLLALHLDVELLGPWVVGVYADGKIYWLHSGPNPERYSLLSFDVESEQATVVGDFPYVEYRFGCVHTFELGQLGSGVSLFIIDYSYIMVWMLKENNSNNDCNDCLWDLRYRIKLPNQIVGGRVRVFWWLVRGASSEVADDLVIVLEDSAIDMFCYGRISLNQRYLEDFHVNYVDTNPLVWYLCSGYKPSLVSLKRYGCSVGEIVVDNGLIAPNIQIP